jgi:hypothetical protein
LTICRSMPASKVRGPLHVHLVTIGGSQETATAAHVTGQTLPVAALACLDGALRGPPVPPIWPLLARRGRADERRPCPRRCRWRQAPGPPQQPGRGREHPPPPRSAPKRRSQLAAGRSRGLPAAAGRAAGAGGRRRARPQSPDPTRPGRPHTGHRFQLSSGAGRSRSDRTRSPSKPTRRPHTSSSRRHHSVQEPSAQMGGRGEPHPVPPVWRSRGLLR